MHFRLREKAVFMWLSLQPFGLYVIFEYINKIKKGRKNMKRTISLLLALVLIMGMVPFSAMALEPAVKFETDTCINPLYADVITEADLNPVREPAAAPHASGDPVYATTLAEAGKQMRQPMVAREETIVVYYQTTNYVSGMHEDVFDAAVAHTGNPDEGDALRWVYAGYKVRTSRSSQNGVTYVTFTYTMTYYTTAEQERELNAAKAQLLATVDPNGTDYEKFCTVYDYICANITYDYDTLYDDDYKLKYTAYAAMINGTAVCQGYAVLLYQLVLELGIDCRVITGIGNTGGHGWNIVKFGDFYYNTDPTWDAIWYQALGYYNYFLQNEVTFTSNYTDHYRDEEYDTTEFHALYPISETNFDPGVYEPEQPAPDSDSCGKGLFWSLEDGMLSISGVGAMYDFDAQTAPWYDCRNEITMMAIDEGVSYIGASAFRDCSNLRYIYFLGSAPQFGDDRVFSGVTASVFYSVADPTWTSDVKLSYGGVLTWEPMCLGHEWGEWLLAAEPTCEENGVMVRSCVHCGDYEEELIPATGHTYNMSAVDPTCTQQGYTVWTCVNCGDSYTDGFVDALGHSWDAGTVIVPPTEDDFGVGMYTCQVCGATENYQIPMLPHEHKYEATVVSPTCTEEGYTTYTCHCGDSYVDDYVDVVDHTYENGACAVCGHVSIAAPVVKGSNKASTGKISLTWEAVEGAEKYEVYRATSKTGKYSRMKTTTSTTYTNTSATAGKYYYYYVRAIDAGGNYADSNIVGRTCDLAQTTVTLSNVASSGKVKISWEAVEGATKYEVYRATSKNGTYSRISTTANTSVTNTKADAGKTYYYKVRAICDVDAAAAAYSAVKSRTCDLPQPSVSIALSSKKPKVSWGKVDGAVEYKVYRATSKTGTYSLVKTTTSLSYKDTKATSGKTYYYKVVAVCSNTAGNSAYSSIVSIKATK